MSYILYYSLIDIIRFHSNYVGDLFGLWPNMSPDSTYAKSLIKLPLNEAVEGSFKLTN